MATALPVVYVCPTPRFESLSLRSRNAQRSSLVRSLLQSISLDQHCTVVSPRMATRDEAALAHSYHYLNLIQRCSREMDDSDDESIESPTSDEESGSEYEGHSSGDQEQLEEAGLVDDCPIFPGLWELESLIVGGSVVAAECLVRKAASVACWFDGGRHHASAENAAGFCYLNDVVVACKVLLSCPRFKKVLYLDIDVHHGDGVENAFLFTDAVITMSLHLCEPGFYPCTKPTLFPSQGPSRHAAVRVPLRRGINDDMYTGVFTASADAAFAFHNPDAIVMQCGVDGVCGDPLGGFNLTGKAYVSCVSHVLAYERPTLILGGGGYNPANAARVWADVLECCIAMGHRDAPDKLPPPGTTDGRDIPICDEYFAHYAPSFSRNIAPQGMTNENSEDEINGILARIKQQLKPR